MVKISSPELDRAPEYELIQTIRERARYLPDYISYMVLSHIPTLYGYRTHSDTATDTIRLLLDLPAKGARVVRMQLFKRLQHIDTHSPDEIWTTYWEVKRCAPSGHALLWKMGICHGDISLSNIMQDPDTKCGILNDYDLASLFNVGETISRCGYRRTGTVPFMALELLTRKGWRGTVSRKYRHDLESFFWVFVWICGCLNEEGKELQVSPFATWMTNNYSTCGSLKAYWVMGMVDWAMQPHLPLKWRRLARDWCKYWKAVSEEVMEEDVIVDEEDNFGHLENMVNTATSHGLIVPGTIPFDFLDPHT
ncbi:hypothetical protein MPER_02847 [Moniliophthora perniciosa FA553]|nr:hypothetical protein MPER_02847 [Moniliophthora perniciosa FA553]